MKTTSITAIVLLVLLAAMPIVAFGATGSRPHYVYDRADILDTRYEQLIDDFARQLDDKTTVEIVVYTISAFTGHGITKDGTEVTDRDELAYHIFNNVALEGITGIGKKDKDNGLLVLYSLQRGPDGSMRIEVGRGLEGNVTDGTAGAILDQYLVPARSTYESTGNKTVFNEAMYNTVTALASRATGLTGEIAADGSVSLVTAPAVVVDYTWLIIIIAAIIIIVIIAALVSGGGGGGGGWSSSGGSGGGGGGYGGGGGGSGGGGAGRAKKEEDAYLSSRRPETANFIPAVAGIGAAGAASLATASSFNDKADEGPVFGEGVGSVDNHIDPIDTSESTSRKCNYKYGCTEEGTEWYNGYYYCYTHYRRKKEEDKPSYSYSSPPSHHDSSSFGSGGGWGGGGGGSGGGGAGR